MVQDITALQALDRFDRLDRYSRATFALARVEHLAEVGSDLRPTDRHGLAASIWSDYIDGRQSGWISADEDERAQQANVLARLAPYFEPEEILALALDTWGERGLQALLIEQHGHVTRAVGTFGWYPKAEALVITWHPDRLDARGSFSVTHREAGEVHSHTKRMPAGVLPFLRSVGLVA